MNAHPFTPQQLAKLTRDEGAVYERKHVDIEAMWANAPDEQWLPAPDYEGRYEVSSFGRVRSLPRTEIDRIGRRHPIAGGLLNPMTHPDGYLQVSLRKGGKMRTVRVHRLVGLAFHGVGNALHNELAHLDGNPRNARADNLKWVSKLENHSHRYRHGTTPVGERHPQAKLSEEQVRDIKRRLRCGETGGGLAREYGVSAGCVESIRRGHNWRHVVPSFAVLLVVFLLSYFAAAFVSGAGQ